MVEKSHTASGTESDWWPALYDPLRRMGKLIADFFAPDADAAATEDKYVINVELPGVAAEDVEVAVHDHVLTLKGEKKSEHEETGKSYFFQRTQIRFLPAIVPSAARRGGGRDFGRVFERRADAQRAETRGDRAPAPAHLGGTEVTLSSARRTPGR